MKKILGVNLKTFSFIIGMTLLFMSSMLIAENSNSFKGNCYSNDSTLHYDNFVFFKASLTSYTHVYSFYCDSMNVEDIGNLNILKKFYQPFSDITYDTVHYALGAIVPHLIYHKRDSVNSKNEFLIELNHQGASNPLAYVYGSDNVTEHPNGLRQTLSYLVSLDSNDSYASSYTQQELVFLQIYNIASSYLYEIRDIDRNSLLVGFKYYSPSTQSEKIKFILPNN